MDATAARARPGFIGRETGNPVWLPILTAVCLTLALAMVADTIATVVRLHSALPYFDEWDDLDRFRFIVDGDGSFWDLFGQHNEHRIFFPRLILYSDLLFFGGRGILNGFAILVVQGAHAALLIGLLRTGCPTRFGHLALSSVILVLFASLRQEENFSWGFQVQFVGIFAVASLSFVLFAVALDRTRAGHAAWGWLASAWLTAFVATFTMANGLLSALVLVGLALGARAPFRVVLLSVAVALVLAAAYLHGYEPQPAHTPLGFSLRHPLRVMSYTAVYLGNFLHPDLAAARALGFWGFAGFAFAAMRVFWMRDTTPPRLALFGIMAFTLGTALITALGRVGFGLDQALSSRYSSGSAAFWAALLIYGWSVADRWSRPALLRGAVGFTALVLVAGAVRAQGDTKDDMEQRAYGQALSTDALLLGLHDPIAFGTVDDDAKIVASLSDFLKGRGLSIFRERDAFLVGRPLSEAGTLIEASACRGSFDDALEAPDLGTRGARVSGHAWSLGHRHETGRFYIVDRGDKVVGLASRQPPGEDPSGWNGFAVAQPNEPLRAFALLWNRELCPVGAGAAVAAAAPGP